VKIAITGGRDHIVTIDELVTFWHLFGEHKGTELHHGAARGVDLTIARAAQECGDIVIVAHPVHPLDWEQHGKVAGFIRNVKMLSCVDMLIAFPGGRGTRNCVQRAKLMKIPIVYVSKGDTK
jgi:predicted Rossmann-fold nucleotide-binding protein